MPGCWPRAMSLRPLCLVRRQPASPGVWNSCAPWVSMAPWGPSKGVVFYGDTRHDLADEVWSDRSGPHPAAEKSVCVNGEAPCSLRQGFRLGIDG